MLTGATRAAGNPGSDNVTSTDDMLENTHLSLEGFYGNGVYAGLPKSLIQHVMRHVARRNKKRNGRIAVAYAKRNGCSPSKSGIF